MSGLRPQVLCIQEAIAASQDLRTVKILMQLSEDMVFDLLLIKTNYCFSLIFESARTSLNSSGIPFHSYQGCWDEEYRVVFLIYEVEY